MNLPRRTSPRLQNNKPPENKKEVRFKEINNEETVNDTPNSTEAEKEIQAKPITMRKEKELPYLTVPPLAEVSRPETDARKPSQTDQPPTTLGPAYKTKPPIEKVGRVQAVYDEVMDTEVSIKLKDLLSNAPQVREIFRKNVTPVRKPTVSTETLASFILAGEGDGQLAAEVKVANDPYLQLYQQGEREVQTATYTSKESESLRSVWPRINGVEEVEAILDSGSQIVSMAEEIAMRTGVSWDPDVTIDMQSANKSVNRTLGLARNVPFTFGNITVYLQVHIIRNPAYTILMGRTFDSLTRSQLQNEHDGTATLRIEDPNSERKSVVPTFERGHGPRQITEQRRRQAEGF